MYIRGNKVSLHAVTEADLDFLSHLECNPDVWLYEEHIEENTHAVKEKYLEQIKSRNHHDFIITIETEYGLDIIGIVQVWSYVEHRNSWELGYGILPVYQGLGYGAESVKLILDYTFQQLKAHKVVAMCNRNNIASIKLLEKCKLNREGVFKEELKWRDEWHDQYFYSILEREWHELTNK